MVRSRTGWSNAGYAPDAQYGQYDDASSVYDQPLEAEVIDLDDDEPNASDDARAIRSACEAIIRYIAPYIEHVRGDVPAVEAVRLAEARALVEEALALLA